MDVVMHGLVHTLIFEEIERIVGEAFRERRILKTGRHAFFLQQSYPNCGLSPAELVNEIAASAACAGVPVELSGMEAPPTFLASKSPTLPDSGPDPLT